MHQSRISPTVGYVMSYKHHVAVKRESGLLKGLAKNIVTGDNTLKFTKDGSYYQHHIPPLDGA